MSDSDKLAEIKAWHDAGYRLALTDIDWLLATCAAQAGEIEKAEQEIFQLEDDKAKLCADVARWKHAIEGLTPSGSEFVNDPEACAAHIRRVYSPAESFKNLRAELAELKARCERLEGALNETANFYASALDDEVTRSRVRLLRENAQYVLTLAKEQR